MNHKLNLSIIGFVLTTIAGMILLTIGSDVSYLIAGGIGQYMIVNLVLWIISLSFLIKILRDKARKKKETIQSLKDRIRDLEDKE